MERSTTGASDTPGPAAVVGGIAAEDGTEVLFKAACPDCRAHVELSAGALRLAIGGSRRSTFYSFTCPGCGAAVRKPAGDRIVELLADGGVRTLRSL